VTDTVFIVVVVGLTSSAAVLLGRRAPSRSLASAAGKALESAGLVAVFMLLNMGAGFCLAHAARRIPGGFVSLYVNDDVALLVLSALQALVAQWWREPEPARPGP